MAGALALLGATGRAAATHSARSIGTDDLPAYRFLWLGRRGMLLLLVLALLANSVWSLYHFTPRSACSCLP